MKNCTNIRILIIFEPENMKVRFFILLQFIFFTCFAQQYSYRHFTIFDGLPQNQITRVFQRSDGIFFFGTKSELGGFDGNRFKVFNNKYISQSHVRGFIEIGNRFFYFTRKAILQFENGKSYLIKDFEYPGIHTIRFNHKYREFFIISDSALLIYSPEQAIFTCINNGVGRIIDAERIQGTNDVLLVTHKGIYRLDKNKNLTSLIVGQGNAMATIGKKIYFILATDDSHSGENSGVFSYDGNKLQKIYTFKKHIPGSVLIKTKNNNLIFTQDYSAWIRIDTSGQVVDHDSVPDMFLTDIVEDSNGNLFIGTESGILHQQSYAFRNYDWKSSMPRYVWSIFEDHDSTIVFASFHGRLFQMRHNVLSEVPGYRNDMAADEVFYMNGFCNSLGQWMIPTNYRIFINDHGRYKFLHLNHKGNLGTCLATYEDTAKKNVYFGTTNGLFIYNLISENLKRIDTKGFNTVAIEKDLNGDLWICTNKMVFTLKYDSLLIASNKTGLPNSFVVSCKRDPSGNIWYAKKDGLFFYNYKRHFKIADGHYFFVSLWNDKKIIAGGVEGLTVIDLSMFAECKAAAFERFDRFNGFLGIECGQNGTCVDSRGKVWIPTSESVVLFDPRKTVYDTIPPRPFFVSFEHSSMNLVWEKVDVPWKPTDNVIELDPGQSNIRIVFSGLEYLNREKVKFKYSLLGYSDIWTETTKDEAIFTNLSPGKYSFELMSANRNGFWSKPPEVLLFRLKPALHQTWGFKAGAIFLNLLIVAGIVFIIMRRKQIRRNKEMEVQKELVSMQVKTINAQLDPHFIFNTITAIGSEVLDKNQDKAYAYFVKVSHLLRNSIRGTDALTRTIGEEIQFVENYLSLQKFRFEDRFSYNIEVEKSVNLKQSVPKLCVQIFAENAVKHGIEQLSGGGLLHVSISKKGNNTIFIVADNGVGRAASARKGTQSTGVGLRVLGEFFEILNRYNDEQAGFVIHDLYNEKGDASGTRVELTIPDSYRYEIL